MLVIQSLETGRVREVVPQLQSVSRNGPWHPDGRSFLVIGTDGAGTEGRFQVDVQSGEAKLIATNEGM